MEKCDSPVVIQRCSLFFFSFIEEPRINAQKEPKRGTLLTSWVFRTLPGFIKDKTHAGQGAAPTPGELRIPGDLFVKNRYLHTGGKDP